MIKRWIFYLQVTKFEVRNHFKVISSSMHFLRYQTMTQLQQYILCVSGLKLIHVNKKGAPEIYLVLLHQDVKFLTITRVPHANTYVPFHHYNDVIMSAMAFQSLASRLFTRSFIHGHITENIKAPRYWSLWEEFTGDQWIYRTKGQ